MKRFILFIFSILLTFCFATAQNFSQWTDSIQYSINSLDTDTNAVISIKIGFDSNMNTDYSDLRFEDVSYNSLPYWIEYYDIDSVKVWLKCNLLLAGLNTISAYYGNPFAISESNGDSVFELFDDFNVSVLNTNKWTNTIQGGASYTISGGELIMNVTQTDNFVSIDTYDQYELSQGYSFIMKARSQTTRGHVFIGYGNGNSLERVNNGGYNLQNGFGLGQNHVAPWGAKCVSNLLGNSSVIEDNTTIYNRFNSIRTINEIQFYSNDTLQFIETDSIYFDYGNRNFYLWLNGWDMNNRTLWIDYVGLYKITEYTAIALFNGCTDSTACNYDFLANTDDGGCNYATTSTATVATCDSSYTWNDSTYTQSGTYSYDGASNNYSMSFDGLDDDIMILNTFNPSSFSINLWLKTTSSPSQIFRINFDGGKYFLLDIHNNGLFYTSYSGGSVTNTTIIGDGLWHYITFTYENGILIHYVDGVLTSNNNIGLWNTLSNTPATISLGVGTNNHMSGIIDDFSLWNTVLSQQEIQNYMNCPPTGTESALVGYWNFEQGSGTTAYDQTSNGNNGTINGATYDTNVPSQSCGLTNVNGCDSLAVLDLTINYSLSVFDTTIICSNDSFFVGSNIYTLSGDYIDTLITADGCDSIVYSHIIVNDINIIQQDTTICNSDSLLLQLNGYCDSSQPIIGNLLYSATQSFGSSWNINWSVNVASDYILRVVGTYGIANNSNHLDAAFSLSNQTPYNAMCTGYLDKWRLLDGCPARPISDVYNSNHEYFYFIDNSDGTVNIDFADGAYGDNSGSLFIELYEAYDTCVDNNLLWSTGDTTSTILVSPSQTTTYWVQQTQNGVSCIDSVTITVNSDTSYTNITACDSVVLEWILLILKVEHILILEIPQVIITQ